MDISWNMLKKYPTFAEQAREIRAVLDSADAIVAHNAVFDISIEFCLTRVKMWLIKSKR